MLKIQGERRCTLTHSADVNTFNMFVSLCANHVMIGRVTGCYYGVAVRNHSCGSDSPDAFRTSEVETGRFWGILSPSPPCPGGAVPSLALSHWPLTPWCFQGHLTCGPLIVCGSFSPDCITSCWVLNTEKDVEKQQKRLLMLLMILFSDFVNCKLYFKINKIF